MSPHPLLYAHRGASRELPENTMAAFRRALELGADALETDVHLSRDGVLMVSHDASGARTALIRREISRCDRAELAGWDVGRGRGLSGYPMPTLEELLSELPDVPLNVDLKQHDAKTAEAAVALIHRLRAEDRVTLASFDSRTLARARRAGYRGRTSLGMREVVALLATGRAPAGVRLLQIPPRFGPIALDGAERFAAWHRAGFRIELWTIDDPAEASRLLERGADGLMTNDPAALAPIFAARRGVAAGDA